MYRELLRCQQHPRGSRSFSLYYYIRLFLEVGITIIISLLLGVCFTASAADGNDGHITVDTVTAVNGDTVVVKLTMSENPGIMAMTISVTYDSSVLTYEKFYRGYLRDYTVADHPDENLIRFVNCENGNARNNAVIVSFQFKVKDSAAFGFYPINNLGRR